MHCTAQISRAPTELATLRCIPTDALTTCRAVQKDTGCWWDGIIGRCEVYNALIPALFICVAGDFLATGVTEMAGSMLHNRPRCSSALATTSMKHHIIMHPERYHCMQDFDSSSCSNPGRRAGSGHHFDFGARCWV